MERQNMQTVIDKVGRRGSLGEIVTDRETGSEFTTIQLEDGRSILVLSSMLIVREDGSYYLPLDLDQLEQQRSQRPGFTTDQTTEQTTIDGDQLVLPIIEEQLVVSKRAVGQATVRIHTRTVEREEIASQTLMHERVEVERVPINQFVEAAQAPREEGDLLIVPIYEERLVVEKRLVLTEELRIRRTRSEEAWSEPVRLRRQEVEIERVPTTNTTE
ncbi:MAG: YsnF/AvaK domain-containing protein [Roseiflexaceae bacterium]|nr:YsnF/AvaK domain-containing protein [Roseiflexaceae bacterium]